MDDTNKLTPDASEASAPPTRARHAGGGGAEVCQGKRFSAKRKRTAAQRLVRGKGLEALSRG